METSPWRGFFFKQLKMKESIDAVISWVDGYDPAHEKKLSLYLQEQGIKRENCAHPTRFDQCGEINYCLVSILKYAPWIRTIYIITDNQIPQLGKLSTLLEKKIKIIDHKNVFRDYENNLPTFNSLSIECVLWRIEGLAERFIYFNDDCFLLRPVKQEDFFREDKLVLRGSWKVQADKKWRNFFPKMLNKFLKLSSKKTNPHRKSQEISAKLAGFNRMFFHLPHTPFPCFKKIFDNYFSQNPQQFLNNIRFPLRNEQQFWPISLSCHLAIKNNKVIFDNRLKEITINGAFHSLKKIHKLFIKAENKKNVKFLCLQSLDSTEENLRTKMINWLDNSIY